MSIFGDFFEQFRRRSEHRIPMDIPQNILNDLYNDSLEDGQRKESEYSGRHSTFFDNPTGFMSEFEEIFNNFFKGFPVMAVLLPNGNDEMPSLPEHEDMCDNNSTLQGRMLNDKKQSHHHSSQFPFSVDGFIKRPEKQSRIIDDEPVTREDRNLDEDLKAGDKSLDDILPRGNVHPNPPFSVSGSFTSSSVTRNSNGIVERKKTVRDSRGNEQVTITRRVGDKEYTVTHKTYEDGNKETIENVVELDTTTEKNRSELLTPQPQPAEPSPITTWPPSLYGRLRTWFFNDD